MSFYLLQDGSLDTGRQENPPTSRCFVVKDVCVETVPRWWSTSAFRGRKGLYMVSSHSHPPSFFHLSTQCLFWGVDGETESFNYSSLIYDSFTSAVYIWRNGEYERNCCKLDWRNNERILRLTFTNELKMTCFPK